MRCAFIQQPVARLSPHPRHCSVPTAARVREVEDEVHLCGGHALRVGGGRAGVGAMRQRLVLRPEQLHRRVRRGKMPGHDGPGNKTKTKGNKTKQTQSKTTQSTTNQKKHKTKTKQNKTWNKNKNKTKQNQTKQANKTTQNKTRTKQNKTKTEERNKTKQNNTKQK